MIFVPFTYNKTPIFCSKSATEIYLFAIIVPRTTKQIAIIRRKNGTRFRQITAYRIIVLWRRTLPRLLLSLSMNTGKRKSSPHQLALRANRHPPVLCTRVRFALNLRFDNTYRHIPRHQEVHPLTRTRQWIKTQMGHFSKQDLTGPSHGCVQINLGSVPSRR